MEKNIHSHKKQLYELKQTVEQEQKKNLIPENKDTLIKQQEQAKEKQAELLREQGEIQGKLSQNQEVGRQFNENKKAHEK